MRRIFTPTEIQNFITCGHDGPILMWTIIHRSMIVASRGADVATVIKLVCQNTGKSIRWYDEKTSRHKPGVNWEDHVDKLIYAVNRASAGADPETIAVHLVESIEHIDWTAWIEEFPHQPEDRFSDRLPDWR